MTDPLAALRPCYPTTTHRYRRVGESDILCCVRCGQGKRDIVGAALVATPPAIDPERRLIKAALMFYCDQMPAYAAAAGLTKDEYAAVMVDVRRAAAIIAAYEAEP